MDEDEQFVADQSDDETEKLNQPPLQCSSCKMDFQPSTNSADDFMCYGMCDACSEKFKLNLAQMEKSNASMEDMLHAVDKQFRDDASDISGDDIDPSTASVKIGQDKSDAPDMSEVDGDLVDSNVNKSKSHSGSTKTPSNSSTLSDDSNDRKMIDGDAKHDDDMSYDVMLAAVFSCGSKSGRVTIHDLEYEFSACPKFISGRGGGTTMIITEYSKSIPDLFGYYYYGGMYTRCFSAMAFTMTECGNLFMGVMETMCNKCRIDPVIYFADTNTCRIINDRVWRKQFKLNSILILTIDIDVAKRYVINLIINIID